MFPLAFIYHNYDTTTTDPLRRAQNLTTTSTPPVVTYSAQLAVTILVDQLEGFGAPQVNRRRRDALLHTGYRRGCLCLRQR